VLASKPVLASIDAYDLNHLVHGMLLGQQVADPIDHFRDPVLSAALAR